MTKISLSLDPRSNPPGSLEEQSWNSFCARFNVLAPYSPDSPGFKLRISPDSHQTELIDNEALYDVRARVVADTSGEGGVCRQYAYFSFPYQTIPFTISNTAQLFEVPSLTCRFEDLSNAWIGTDFYIGRQAPQIGDLTLWNSYDIMLAGIIGLIASMASATIDNNPDNPLLNCYFQLYNGEVKVWTSPSFIGHTLQLNIDSTLGMNPPFTTTPLLTLESEGTSYYLGNLDPAGSLLFDSIASCTP